jgi:hypothetical protein
MMIMITPRTTSTDSTRARLGATLAFTNRRLSRYHFLASEPIAIVL